jgi:hypothetical protein
MKHLKSYKLFESTEDLDYTFIEEIKEILLPFSDMSMKVSCDYTDNGNSISINIMTLKEKAFDINDYKSDIDALLSYMKENNWGIWKFNLGIVEQKEDWSGTFLLAKDQEVLSYKNGPIQYDKVKSPTFWIIAEFVKIVYAKARQIKESKFVEFKEVVSTIKDICQEFEDNNCNCEITPEDNDIRLNIISLKSRGHLGSIKMPFYLEIDIDRRIIVQDEKRSGFGPFPEWFIETCRRIEDFMLSEGFNTLPSVRYPTDWVNLDIDELEEQTGLIQKVKLEFIPNEVSKDI